MTTKDAGERVSNVIALAGYGNILSDLAPIFKAASKTKFVPNTDELRDGLSEDDTATLTQAPEVYSGMVRP